MKIETTVGTPPASTLLDEIRSVGGFVYGDRLYIIDDEENVLSRSAGGARLYLCAGKLDEFVRVRHGIRVAGPGDSLTITF